MRLEIHMEPEEKELIAIIVCHLTERHGNKNVKCEFSEQFQVYFITWLPSEEG